MPSLTSLVARHRNVLLVDAASSRVQVGLLRGDTAPVWRQSPREAGRAIFEGVEAVTATARTALSEVEALVYCEGPGSILGIRTAAMALRTWQSLHASNLPAFAYRSLELVAHNLAVAGTPPPFAVVADARRDSWYLAEAADKGGVQSLRRISAAALAGYAGRLYTPAGFRAWVQPQPTTVEVPYLVPELWARQAGADLLRPVAQPDALQFEEPAYARWTPQIHRAPTRKSL